MMLFLRLNILQEPFQKSLKIQFSYWIFIKNFQNISEFPNNLFFLSIKRKGIACFVNSLEEIAKIMDFTQFP